MVSKGAGSGSAAVGTRTAPRPGTAGRQDRGGGAARLQVVCPARVAVTVTESAGPGDPGRHSGPGRWPSQHSQNTTGRAARATMPPA